MDWIGDPQAWIGLLTLAAYMKLGHERRETIGERYVPTWAAPAQHR